jgi:hypothetical protein
MMKAVSARPEAVAPKSARAHDVSLLRRALRWRPTFAWAVACRVLYAASLL